MEAGAELKDTDSLEGHMKLEPRGTDASGFNRAVGTMHILITICLVLELALFCLFVAVGS